MKDVGVLRLEHLGLHRAQYLVLDLLRCGPDVAKENGTALADSDRLGVEVDVHPTSERIRNHQGWRRQIIESREWVDPGLESGGSGEPRRHGELFRFDCIGDRLRQRARVSDSGRASEA